MAMELSKEEVSVSNWNICSILGRGSFGVVYFGVSTKPHLDDVAIKVAPSRRAASLLKETVILEELIGAPEIVQYIGEDFTFEGEDCFYNMILEYAPGGTLLDLITKQGTLEEREIKQYLRMILKGLSSIHEIGLVHCDLKPENILVFPLENGEIKLKIADFGLSKWCGEKREEEGKKPRLSFKGTARYMSPESLFGEVDPALDIWSLGCVFVNMITGEPMWIDCSDTAQLVRELMYGSKIPNISVKLSDEGKDFLDKCLERKHKRRWTAEMLLQHPFLVEKEQTVKKKSFGIVLPIVVGVCSMFALYSAIF